MNLLLLLSAMLSALTGIGSSTRVPEAGTTIAAKVEVVRIPRQAAVAPSVRPIQSTESIGDSAGAPLSLIAVPRRDEPIFATRRRE